MKKLMKSFVSDDRGLETVEYAIMTALIVVATIGIIAAIGQWVFGKFNTLNTELQKH